MRTDHARQIKEVSVWKSTTGRYLVTMATDAEELFVELDRAMLEVFHSHIALVLEKLNQEP